MTDRRETASNGRVAHVSLEGHASADRFVEGDLKQVWNEPFLLDAPMGQRERQLLHGDPFLVLEERQGWCFGRSEKDGYCGYVLEKNLTTASQTTHRVAVRQSHFYPEADFKTIPTGMLSLNAQLRVLELDDAWATIVTPAGHAFVPSVHLRSLTERQPDLVSTAELMIGVPYVWGGNSAYGIDCSGLVSASCQAAGLPCPGDSDLQEGRIGEPIEGTMALLRNDLVFWRGHVAIATGDGRIIHANAHAMAVSFEDFHAACHRIEAAGDGPVTTRLRL